MEKYRKPVGCLADTPSSQLVPLQRATTDLRLPTRLFGRTPVVGSRTLKTIGSGRGWEYGEIPEAGWLDAGQHDHALHHCRVKGFASDI